uniref:Secretory carrier-associated membrane protein n=1 Tax=Eptatretus burgeri TaxID=7764 RepID=A0A8C4RAP6_EPTBU
MKKRKGCGRRRRRGRRSSSPFRICKVRHLGRILSFFFLSGSFCQPVGYSLSVSMADLDSNPFADPNDVNPFQDPSVTQAGRNVQPSLAEYTPFAHPTHTGENVPPTQTPPAYQPAVMQPTVEPPAYTQQGYGTEASAAQSELLRRQEELERKAAELDRREREMQGIAAGTAGSKNWPPLPSWFPLGPCFYQDITIEIPVQFQKVVKMLYYLWIVHAATLCLNVLGCLAWFCVDSTRGVDFGLSILWFIIFTPCSYLCWFRPAYKAFKSDSSFNFFAFFFIFFSQFVIHVMQSIGIPNWGNCGWIASLAALNRNIVVGILLMFLAACFTASAVLAAILIKKVEICLQGEAEPVCLKRVHLLGGYLSLRDYS